MKLHRRSGRRFHGPGRAIFETLESRVLLSVTGYMVPLCDSGDDGGGDDSSPPPADTQPVTTQPTDPSGTDDGSNDNGGMDDSPPVDETPLPPGRPARVTLQMPTPTSVFLSWKEPSGDADSFDIERLGPTGGWKTIATVGAETMHYTDKGLQPGGTYSYDIVAENEGGTSDESNDVTTTIAAEADPSVIGEFGKLPGGGASVPLSFFDVDGTKVTLTMSGPGVGAVRSTDAGYTLTLTGTTMNSRVSIVTAKTRTVGDDGRFDLAGIAAGDGLGSLSAGTTDVMGDVSIGNAGVTAGSLVNLKFGLMGDVTVNSEMGIRALTVESWSSGEMEASSVGTLSVTGGKGIAGNFGAAVSLSGPAGGKATLGKVTVAGAITGGSWEIGGAVNAVLVKGAATGWTVDAGSMQSLKVAGMLSASAIRVTGNIGTVRVGGVDHTLLFAGILSSEEGLPATDADFANAASTINSVQITGKSDSLVDSDFAAGSIVRVTMPQSVSVVSDVDQSGNFGFATLVGNVHKYKGPASVGNYVAGLDSAVG